MRPELRRFFTGALALLLLAPAAAAAFEGERRLGAEAAIAYPPAGRITAFAEEGLSDYVVARFDLGAQGGVDAVEGLAAFGFSMLFDVVSVVPELYLGVGAAAGTAGLRARLIAKGALRLFLAIDWALTFGLALEWTPVESFQGLALVGVAFDLSP